MEDNERLLNFFGGNCWSLNKSAVKSFGIEKTLWLTYLFEQRDALIKSNQIKSNDSFSVSQNQIFRDTGISIDKQTKFVSYFSNLQIISKQLKGIPAKYFYRINDQNFNNIIGGRRI